MCILIKFAALFSKIQYKSQRNNNDNQLFASPKATRSEKRALTNEDDSRWEEMEKQDPIIEKAVDILKTASLDPLTRMQYEAREKALKDIVSIRGDGVREGKQEIAKKMLKKRYGS